MGPAADCDTDHESSVWLESCEGQGEHVHMCAVDSSGAPLRHACGSPGSACALLRKLVCLFPQPHPQVSEQGSPVILTMPKDKDFGGQLSSNIHHLYRNMRSRVWCIMVHSTVA